MELYEKFSRNKNRWAVSILRFAYYVTGVLTVVMLVLPFYSWFIYLRPHFGYLLTGPESIYVAVVAIVYAVTFLIITSILIVLHGLGRKFLLEPGDH